MVGAPLPEGARLPLRAGDGSVRAWVRIDAADYDWLARHRWHLNDGYAARRLPGDRPDRQRCLLMHRAILGLTEGDGRKTDHVNRDRLDNRRSNLRVVTSAANSQNIPAKGRSTYRGVSWHAANGKWMARGKLNGVEHYLGVYDDEAEAGAIAAAWRAEFMPYSEEAAA